MIIILDHYYYCKHASNCLIIETEHTAEDVAEIFAALQFQTELIYGGAKDITDESLLYCLENFYGAKNVTSKMRSALKERMFPIESMIQETKVLNQTAYIVDRYSAREDHCGALSSSILEKWLPKEEEQLTLLKSALQCEKE